MTKRTQERLNNKLTARAVTAEGKAAVVAPVVVEEKRTPSVVSFASTPSSSVSRRYILPTRTSILKRNIEFDSTHHASKEEAEDSRERKEWKYQLYSS